MKAINPHYIREVKLKKPVSKNSYLAKLPAINYLSSVESLPLNNDITFFIGENGTGKSTLLEAIAVAYGFNAEGGTRNFNFNTNKTHSELWEHITIVKSSYPKDGFFLRAESFYNVATNIDQLDQESGIRRGKIIDSYGGVSLHNQSHGESFLALVQNRFGGNGIYILDEPEAALSPTRLLTLMWEINNLIKDNSQFILLHIPPYY